MRVLPQRFWGPALAALVVAGLARPLAGQSGWRDERLIGPFVCRADFPLAEVHTLVAHLHQLQQDLSADLGIPAPQRWIEVYLFHDRTTYDRYLARHFPAVPYRRALYLKTAGQGRVFAWRSPQFEIDVRHECTHALLHAALCAVPLWLDEGLAEHYENPPGHRFRHAPQFSEAVWAARLGTLGPLAPLEAKQRVEEMGPAQYRDAWAWVCFLLYHSPSARQQLTEYLAELAQPGPVGPLGTRLHQRMPGFEREFLRFWQAPPPSSARLEPRRG